MDAVDLELNEVEDKQTGEKMGKSITARPLLISFTCDKRTDCGGIQGDKDGCVEGEYEALGEQG